MAEQLHPLKLASLLLLYPDDSLREAAAAVPEAEIGPGPERAARELRGFSAWYAARPLGELQRHYVDSFDFAKQCSLHLTYHVHGDRRQRGMAMLKLKEAYRAAGVEPPGDELPDYLPLMLEFAAIVPDGRGRDLLEDHRVSLELVRAGLRRAESPYQPVLDAVVACLGRLSSPQARPDPGARRLRPAGRGGRARAVRAARGDAGRRPGSGNAAGRWAWRWTR